MLFVKTPILIMKLFPELIWHFSSRKESRENQVFLTFDDGPTPEVTPWVLDCLKEYDARGTFFCLGRNVDKYPEIYNQILDGGHAVGNHTYSHLKGWKSSDMEYIDDIRLASHNIESQLFRPPYGRFRQTQIREIRKDYDKKNLYYTLPQIMEEYSGKYKFLPIVKTPGVAAQKIAV